ncbi:hypothetical protein GOP47_0025287 [Adiantum capillus-veneris]|uniref:Uncharacterized protein n=1 Tax=Adiantum capillus-veneris TaxID=13818 RepID=A0A9D4U113_ADICA|nr:hypothetical protein GOP47_0025287 [Adiantum capillus-veneris]
MRHQRCRLKGGDDGLPGVRGGHGAAAHVGPRRLGLLHRPAQSAAALPLLTFLALRAPAPQPTSRHKRAASLRPATPLRHLLRRFQNRKLKRVLGSFDARHALDQNMGTESFTGIPSLVTFDLLKPKELDRKEEKFKHARMAKGELRKDGKPEEDMVQFFG